MARIGKWSVLVLAALLAAASAQGKKDTAIVLIISIFLGHATHSSHCTLVV